MKFLASAGTAIFQENGRKIVAEAIHHRHQYANLRGKTCHDDRIHAEGPECLVEIRFEEGAKASLG